MNSRILALMLLGLCGCQQKQPVKEIATVTTFERIGYSYDPDDQKAVDFVVSHVCHQTDYSPAHDHWSVMYEEVKHYTATHEYRCDGVDGAISISEAGGKP